MELKSYLAIGLVALTFAGGFALDRKLMNTKLDEANKAHQVTTNNFALFRDESKKLSDDLIKQHRELLDESNKKAEIEIEKGKSSLATANSIVSGLRITNSKLRASISTARREALEEYSAVSTELLGACYTRLVWYAGEANGHRIDAQRCLNAWPETKSKGIQLWDSTIK